MLQSIQIHFMKRFIAIITAVFLFSTSFSQVRKIPAEVTESFKQKYPEATKVEWRDKLSTFSAIFEIDDQLHEAKFNSKGEWQQTETAIEEDDLPEAVTDGFEKSKYAEWEISGIYKIEMNDTVHYRIEAVKTDIRKKNLFFNSEGRLVKDRITL